MRSGVRVVFQNGSSEEIRTIVHIIPFIIIMTRLSNFRLISAATAAVLLLLGGLPVATAYSITPVNHKRTALGVHRTTTSSPALLLHSQASSNDKNTIASRQKVVQNKNAPKLVRQLVQEENCFSTETGARAFGEACADTVIYDDCFEPEPFVGKEVRRSSNPGSVYIHSPNKTKDHSLSHTHLWLLLSNRP